MSPVYNAAYRVPERIIVSTHYSPVVTICTMRFKHSEILRSAHTVCFLFYVDRRTKQRLFRNTALTDWF